MNSRALGITWYGYRMLFMDKSFNIRHCLTDKPDQQHVIMNCIWKNRAGLRLYDHE